MAPPGGSATSYGIVYQLLGAVHWAASLSLSLDGASVDATDVTILIEPTGGGGDHQIHTPHRVVVEQWKTRAGNRTWSFREVVEEVLPDLYRAVPDPDDSREFQFRFVTDGRRGNWGGAQALLDALRCPTPVGDAGADLDDVTPIRFSGMQPDDDAGTQRRLFDWVVRRLRESSAASGDDDARLRRKARFLLARFDVAKPCTLSELHQRISDQLLLVIEDRAEVSEKISQLVGHVATLAGRGNVPIEPASFLRDAGLSPEIVTRLRDLPTVAGEILARRAAWLGYEKNADVRPTPTWPGDVPIVAITGDVGTGRTWRLHALAAALAADHHVCAMVTATGSAANDLALVVETIWNQALLHERRVPFDGFSARLDAILGASSSTRLVVFVDDVHSAEEARELIIRTTSRPSVRLALVTEPGVVADLRRHGLVGLSAQIAELPVSLFTDGERNAALARRGVDWTEVPADTRSTLNLPLLAGLYARHGETQRGWSPRFEYELFAMHWGALTTTPSAPDTLLKLVAETLAGGRYPWSRTVRDRVGATHEQLQLLKRVGWLREVASGEYGVPHERFLDWAAAERLHECWREDARGRSEAFEIIVKIASSGEPIGGRRWSFVVGDFLWLLAGSESSAVVAELLGQFGERLGGRFVSDLCELLATFDGRAVPVLAQLARSDLGERAGFLRLSIREALIPLGKVDRGAVHRAIEQLLDDERDEVVEVALAVLNAHPTLDFVEAAWTHVRRCMEVPVNALTPLFDHAYNAVRACVSDHPEWLRERLVTCGVNDPSLRPLLALLGDVAPDGGRAIWQDLKRDLFSRVPAKLQWILLGHVGRFRDIAEIPQLLDALNTGNEWAAGEAFTVLSTLRPETAVSMLDSASCERFRFGRSEWIPELLTGAAEPFQARLRAIVAAAPATAFHWASMLQSYTNELEAQTLVTLLDALEATLPDAASPEDPRASAAINLVLSAARPGLLAVLRDRPGRLGQLLETEVRAQIGTAKSSFWSSPSDDDVRCLMKLGVDVRDLLVLGLDARDAAKNCWAARWCQAVNVRSDLVAGLRTVATVRLPTATPLPPQEMLRQVAAQNAVVALALWGCHRDVVEAVLCHGSRVISPTLPALMPRPDAFDDEVLAPAIAALTGPSDARKRRNAVWAVMLSGRRDFVAQLHEALVAAGGGDAELQLAACYALQRLHDDSPATLAFLDSSLRDPKRRAIAATALLQNATDAALDSIESYLATRSTFESQDLAIADALIRRRTTVRLGPSVVERLRRAASLFPFLAGSDLQSLVSTPTGPLDDSIVQAAFAERGTVVIAGQRAAAIRLLSTYDSELAWRAAALSLDHDRTDAAEAAALLLELRRDEAIPLLCRRIAIERRRERRVALALALRDSTNRELVQTTASRMLRDPDPYTRAAGAMVCGYQGPWSCVDALIRGLNEETHPVPRAATRTAIAQQRDEQVALDLVDGIGDADSTIWPTILDAVVALVGNPHGDESQHVSTLDPVLEALPNWVEYYLFTHGSASDRRRSERLKAYEWKV